MSPRRILMTADLIGGVWTYALELARSLAPHGVETALATMGAPVTAEQRKEVARLPSVTLHESNFGLEWMDDPWAEVDRAGEWLLALADRVQPDLVHLNGYAHGALTWDAPLVIAGHSCVFSWWEAVHGAEAPARYDEYRRRVCAGLAAADLVVAPSAAMLASLGDHYGFLPRQTVIHNAREASRFTPAVKQARVMCAGRLWDQAKNVRALDAAAPRVRWPIFVAGESQAPVGSRTAVRNLQLLGKVTPERMSAELASSAIFAFPARYEPFGLAALEAGLSGCALVLGDILSLREIWGDAALFVDPSDDAALARTINFLIDHPSERMELGRRARVRALQYSPQTMALEYLSAYRSCLSFCEEAAA